MRKGLVYLYGVIESKGGTKKKIIFKLYLKSMCQLKGVDVKE